MGDYGYEDIIDRANTVPLTKVFHYYGINCNHESPMVTCPLKSHQNGKESTRSFKYYPDSNSVFCFGCRKFGPWAHAPHLVAEMEGISTYKAALKVIELFGDDVREPSGVSNGYKAIDQDEQFEIMFGFSEMIREFRIHYRSDKAFKYIEAACQKFDELYLKLSPDNIALTSIIEEMKKYVMMYQE